MPGSLVEDAVFHLAAEVARRDEFYAEYRDKRARNLAKQVLSFLRRSGLLYESAGGYLLSVPLLVHGYRSRGAAYLRGLRRYLVARERDALKKVVGSGPLWRFSEAYLDLADGLAEPVAKLRGALAGNGVSSSVLAGLFGALAVCAAGLPARRCSPGTILELAHTGSPALGRALGALEAIVRAVASARDRDSALEDAVNWAVENYRSDGGRDTARARYYARLYLSAVFLRRLAHALFNQAGH